MKLIFFINAILLSQYSWGRSTLAHHFVFKNKDCQASKSCDLKGLELKVYSSKDQYDNIQGRPTLSQGTLMEGRLHVTKSSLRKYAIVQYIQGCMFSESQYDNGPKKINTQSHSRDFFDQSINFRHSNWVIDSIDTDPVFASYKEDRHGAYRVAEHPSHSALFSDSRHFEFMYNNPEIKIPTLIFSDLPTGGNYSELLISGGEHKGKLYKHANNASMKFITCVYHTQDVPLNLTPEDVENSKALGCFEWSNSHIYNFKTKKFESPEEISPVCFDD